VTPDPERRLVNRRRIIATLRSEADRLEAEAAELRRRADSMEANTDALALRTTL
jgi:hypothetical protein